MQKSGLVRDGGWGERKVTLAFGADMSLCIASVQATTSSPRTGWVRHNDSITRSMDTREMMDSSFPLPASAGNPSHGQGAVFQVIYCGFE